MKKAIAKTWKKLAIPFVSAVAALLLGVIIIQLTGNSAVEAYTYMFNGAFGTFHNICEVFVLSVPLIFTGLAITFAYRSGMYTIGVDGQLIIGATAASWCITSFPELNGAILITVGILLGMITGGIWGVLAGALKAYRKVNEIVSTLLMNYIALYFVNYLFSGPLASESSKIPQTEKIVDSAKLPILFSGTRLHIGILIAIATTFIIYYILFKTAWGMKFRSVGINQLASNNNGINVKKYMITSMFISGAISGLAGTVELLGTQFKIQDGFCTDFGFDGIAIALIGQLNPIGVIIAALFFGVLNVGSNSMELMTNVPSSIANIIQGIIIVFVVAGNVFVNRNSLKIKLRNILNKEVVTENE